MHSSQLHLVFVLDGRRFALPLDRVRQAARAVLPRPLPGAPDVVLGVVSLRGEIMPMVSLRRRLGLPERPVRPNDRLVFARGPRRDLALLVDDVAETDRRFDDPPKRADDVWPGLSWFDGLARTESGVVLIHDLDRLFSLDEERAVENALRGFGPGRSEQAVQPTAESE